MHEHIAQARNGAQHDPSAGIPTIAAHLAVRSDRAICLLLTNRNRNRRGGSAIEPMRLVVYFKLVLRLLKAAVNSTPRQLICYGLGHIACCPVQDTVLVARLTYAVEFPFASI